jgi:aminopeptidase N
MKIKQVLNLILVCLFTYTSSVNAQTADSLKKLPPAYIERTQKIDVKHIAIDLKFDWHTKQAFGTVAYTLSTLMPSDKITLDAGLLTINSVVLANGKSLKFNYDGGEKNDNLEIILDRIYTPNELILIKIDYHTNWLNKSDPNALGGSFGKGLRFFQPTQTTPLKRKQIWSSGEPENNRYWFPCSEVLSDTRTTEFKATVEKPLMVISNGKLVTTKENLDGTRTFHYKTDAPYPNYLTSFVVGEYVPVKQVFDNIPLQTYCYPDEKTAAEATVERLPDMVKFISETVGYKYPFSQYNQVVVQEYPFPGLNGQNTAPIFSDNFIDDYGTHDDWKYLWDGVETQALASQWFGNLIMPKSWEHNWLNQSFCQFFSGLYTDYKNGHDEYLNYYLYSLERFSVFGDWNAGYRHPIVTKNFSDIGGFTSDNYAKYRGTLVLRMLRKELGEAQFWKVLKHYVKTNAHKQVTTDDFQKSIEAVAGTSIKWFFDQWIYKMGHPIFDVTKTYDASKKQLILTVKQTQKVDKLDEYPQVEFFKGKIEVEIDGRIEQVNLEAKTENIFTFASPQAPKLVNFDFESTWISEISFIKTFDEYLYQAQNDKDVLGRISVIDTLVKIAKSENTDLSRENREGGVKAKICTAFRNIISSQVHWRLKTYALVQLRSLLPQSYDEPTITLLLDLIKNNESWLKASAINTLGMTKDAKYTDIYLNALNDKSDRVVNAAANALGKTKSPKAFDALVKLPSKPSWKSQSLISALNGLQQLGDPRGADLALKALADAKLPRWWLAVPTWDYPIAAAQTLVSLGKGTVTQGRDDDISVKGYPIILERFKKAVEDNDDNDIFSNTLLIALLGDPRGQEVFDILKVKYKDDANAMIAVNQYETQFKEALKK